MFNPRPVGRMRPSRRFCAAQFRFQLQSAVLTTSPYFDNLELTFLMQVVLNATLSRLLPLQLGFERFQ